MGLGVYKNEIYKISSRVWKSIVVVKFIKKILEYKKVIMTTYKSIDIRIKDSGLVYFLPLLFLFKSLLFLYILIFFSLFLFST